MGKIARIYSDAYCQIVNNLPKEEAELISTNEGYVKAMLLDISSICNRYSKMGVEFDAAIRAFTKEDGTAKIEYRNNYFK